LIGRDALEISVSPAQNFLKPPPVPEVPTETLTLGFSALNSSPAAAASGATVDEPSTRTSVEATAGAAEVSAGSAVHLSRHTRLEVARLELLLQLLSG